MQSCTQWRSLKHMIYYFIVINFFQEMILSWANDYNKHLYGNKRVALYLLSN
jgi:hypothetical protein